MSEEAREGELLAGKYLVERVLGRGGMGVVVLAKHVELDENVALKLMLPEMAKVPEAVARFQREARAAAKIKSEHVVRVSDVGMLEEGRPFMAMELLEGADLRQVLTARGRLPVEEAAEYLLQALEALGEAHALGIVHRDLKPGNLFVTRRRDDTPVLKVLDFGISKVLSGTLAPLNPLTQVSALMGSPMYMSPEQMKASRDIDARADLWAVGVILYELLTGDVPFKGESLPELCAMIVLDGEAPRARDLAPGVPEALDAVIARCLARKPDDRFANAAELARALAPFAPERARVSVARVTASLAPTLKSSHPGTPAVTESATNATWSGSASQRRPRKSSWWWLAAAVLGAFAAVGLSLASKVHSGRAQAASGVPHAVVQASANAPATVTPAAPVATPPAAPVAHSPSASTSAAPRAPASATPSAAPARPAASTATPRSKTPPKPARDDLPFGGRR